MRKNILILVSSIVLFSLFNTIETNFKLWNNPTINTNHIITPDIPISFDTDISLFGLFINFFFDLDLDYSMNNDMTNIISNSHTEDDLNLEVITSKTGVEEIVLRNVQFDHNSYTLTDSSFTELDKFITYLYKNPSLKITIDGHTDNVGNLKQNRLLSKNRAKSVYDYLLREGVSRSQLISYNGYGESNPISTNDTKKGMALNRRTSFRVIKDIASYKLDVLEEVESIKEEVKVPIVKEVIKEEVKVPIVKEVIKEEVKIPIVKEVIKEEVEESYIKSDEEIIRDNSQIKDNAKELILESLKNEIITMDDVVDLLSEHAGKDVKKKHVKKLIKSKKK